MSKTVTRGEFTGQYKKALEDIHSMLSSIYGTRTWTTAEMCVLEVVEDALDDPAYRIVNAKDREGAKEPLITQE